jgi:5'-3' exoribonuclease 1
MGVPSLFAYFFKKYNKCARYVVRKDVSKNGIFHCLYLDFNGIIHACTHPSLKLLLNVSEEEMFQEMIIFIDYLMMVIHPEKLLYIAIDGVAPRAKMNQVRMVVFKVYFYNLDN